MFKKWSLLVFGLGLAVEVNKTHGHKADKPREPMSKYLRNKMYVTEYKSPGNLGIQHKRLKEGQWEMIRPFENRNLTMQVFPYFYNRDTTWYPANRHGIPDKTTNEIENDFERLINQIYIDNPREMLRGHFWLPPDRNRKFRDRVLVQSEVNPGANRQREWIKKFWNIPNTVPLTNLMMAQTLDIMPATNYIWVIIVYGSHAPDWLNDYAYQLAVAASEYFYEYAMVGTLDMAYPSNAESFGNIAVDYPSIIVKYAHTDQKFMMIQESNEKKLHIQFKGAKSSHDSWGNFYHRLQLQDDIEKIFAKIMKLHTYQEDWFRLKAIYNDFYGDPAKDPLKKYIKRLEVHIHNKLERKGLTDFRIKKGLTGVRQSPIVNKFYTDHYTPEYSLKKAFDFLDRKEFNYYMWWFQFIDKEDANLRVHLEDAIDELHDQNIFKFYELLEPRTPPDMRPFYESWREGTKNWRRFSKNAQIQPPPDTLIKIVDEDNFTREVPFRETQFYIEPREEKVDTSKVKVEL